MAEQKKTQKPAPEQDLNQQRKVRREKLAALQKSLADAQARAQAAEKTAAQYRQRVEAARAALEG